MTLRRGVLFPLLCAALLTPGCRPPPVCPPARPAAAARPPAAVLADAVSAMKTSGLQVETCRLADGEAPVVTRYASFSPTRSELGELGTKVGKHLRAQFGDLVFGVETVACECNAGSTFGLRLVMRADAPVEHVVRATFEVAGSDPTLRLPLALVPAPPPPACAEPDP